MKFSTYQRQAPNPYVEDEEKKQKEDRRLQRETLCLLVFSVLLFVEAYIYQPIGVVLGTFLLLLFCIGMSSYPSILRFFLYVLYPLIGVLYLF